MRRYTKVHCLSYFVKYLAKVVLFLETNNTVTQKQVESRLEMSFGVFGAAKLYLTQSVQRRTTVWTDLHYDANLVFIVLNPSGNDQTPVNVQEICLLR